MAVLLDPINTSEDTFNTLFQRVNDIVDALGGRVITAGPTTEDTTEGNVYLNGSFRGNTIIAGVSLHTPTLEAPIGATTPILVNSVAEFRSAARNVTQHYHASGALSTFKNNNISWDIGVAGATGTGAGSEFTIGLATATNQTLRLTRDGVVHALLSLNTPTVRTNTVSSTGTLSLSSDTDAISILSATNTTRLLTTDGGLTVAATGALNVNSTARFAGAVTLTANITSNAHLYTNLLTANGAAIFNAPVTFNGPINFTSTLTANISGTANWASNVEFANVRSKPNTLEGYGITNAISNSTVQPHNIFIRNGWPNIRLVNGSHDVVIENNTAGVVNIYRQNTGIRTPMTINTTNGDVDVGRNLTSYGEVYSRSDERSKTNIKDIKDALDKVKRLAGVSYTKDDKKSIGVIAQRTMQVVPEVVFEDSEGYLSVSYGNLVGLLIESIKELDKKVDSIAKNN